MSDDASKDVPWVRPGSTEEHEDELIGNREGFQLLKGPVKAMDDYLAGFNRAAERCRSEIERSKLEVTIGTWLESSVLKLQKRHWASDGKKPNVARSEIFFSVWTNAKGVKLNRAFYNIHALRLRGLRGYKLESWEFASAFRVDFAARQKDWPNVSVDFGPGNLMEGWIVLRQDRLEEPIAELIRRFIPLADLIDRLLEKKSSGLRL